MTRRAERAHQWLTFAAAAFVIAATPIHAQSARPAYETLGPSTADHAAVRILDTLKMPILGREGKPNPLGWGNKTLFQGPQGGTLRIMYVPPGVEGATVHYHMFHEWAYNLQGDFTNNESTTPENYSILQRFREGAFLSRPPYSLHGGERGRMKWMASQVGAEILIMEESPVGGGTFTVQQWADARASGGNMPFNPDYRKVTHWATPRIIDTIDRMPWQPVEGSPGLNVKYLLDDPEHGFRATMWFLEAGAKTPERFVKPFFYKQALQLNFIVNGDLKINLPGAAGQPARTVQLMKQFYVERQPTAVFTLPAENATEGGVVWLEVTYAKGNKWTTELTPIEPPTFIQ